MLWPVIKDSTVKFRMETSPSFLHATDTFTFYALCFLLLVRGLGFCAAMIMNRMQVLAITTTLNKAGIVLESAPAGLFICLVRHRLLSLFCTDSVSVTVPILDLLLVPLSLARFHPKNIGI